VTIVCSARTSARNCDAFLLLEREPTPENPVPFEQLLVDEDKCDYCVLCQDICPEEAIKVKGERPCEAPKVEGTVKVDELKCTQCGRCQAVCPYEAVDLQKPMEGKLSLIELNLKECDPQGSMEGKLSLIEVNLKECDPQGCRGCFNVCPSELWYVPTDPEDPRKPPHRNPGYTLGYAVEGCNRVPEDRSQERS